MDLDVEELPAHRRRWTCDEFERMMEVGLISPRAYELIDGVVWMTSGFRRRFSVHDMTRMVDAGLLTWEEHAELVEGVVTTPPPWVALQCAVRMAAVDFLALRLKGLPFRMVPGGMRVVLDDENMAAPDMCVIRWPGAYSMDEWPRADDVPLMIEVSAAPVFVGHDHRRKQLARFSIPEMWHVDARAETVTVHTTPFDGDYATVRTCGRGESFTSAALDGIEVPVDKLIDPGWPG